MAKYLISFPSVAMVVPEGEWEAEETRGGGGAAEEAAEEAA